MKVALIVEWLDAWRGGAETSTQQFIHELIERGVKLEVFTRSPTPARPGMNVHTIRARGPSRALETLRFCRQADEAARTVGADVIHGISLSLAAQVYQPRGGTLAETIRRNRAVRRTRRGRMLKGVIQRANVKQRLLLKMERDMLLAKEPPIVLALSDYVVRQLRKHYKFPDDHIRKVFNGVAPDDSDAATRAEDRREVRELYTLADNDVVALTVAHNFKLKGVRTLIDALSMLHANDALGKLKVLIVGKASTAAWEQMIGRRGLGHVVQFVGPTARVRTFYHAADMLVHPTFYDPCSRVVLEALASGLPCVTTHYDGAAERVTDGHSGFVLERTGDPKLLADRLTRMLDEVTREQMRSVVAQQAPADMSQHTDAVMAVYQSIAEGKQA